MKRIYETVAVAEAPGGFEIRLDQKPLRTPARAPLVLRSRRLAEAVAAEWEAQGPEIEPRTMPLTQLASTAIDRVAVQREEVIDAVTAYAGTDLLCYRAEGQPQLAARQAALWNPLLDWAALRYDAVLAVTSGVVPRPQNPDALRALRRAVEAMDDMTLAALQNATGCCGSLIVALALVEGRIDAEAAFEVSQLDESYQIEQWGEDEEAARRRAALKADIAATARFVEHLRQA